MRNLVAAKSITNSFHSLPAQMFLKLFSPPVKHSSSSSSSDPECPSEEITPSKIPQLTRRRHSFSHPYPEHALINESIQNESLDQTFDPFEDNGLKRSKTYSYEFFPGFLKKTVRFDVEATSVADDSLTRQSIKHQALAQLSPEKTTSSLYSESSVTESCTAIKSVLSSRDKELQKLFFAPTPIEAEERSLELKDILVEIKNNISGECNEEKDTNNLALEILEASQEFQEAKNMLSGEIIRLQEQLLTEKNRNGLLTQDNDLLKEDMTNLERKIKISGKLYSYSVFDKVEGAPKYKFEEFDLYMSIKALIDKNRELWRENEHLKKEDIENKECLSGQINRIAELDAKVADLEGNVAELDGLKKKVAYLQVQLSVKAAEYDDANTMISSLEEEKQKLQSKYNILKNEGDKTKMQTRELEHEKCILQSSFDNLKDEIMIEKGVLKNLQNELHQIKVAHQHQSVLVKSEIETYQATIDDLQEQLDSSEKDRHDTLDKLNEMSQVLQDTDYELLMISEHNDHEKREMEIELEKLLKRSEELEKKWERMERERGEDRANAHQLAVSNTMLSRMTKRIIKSTFEALTPVLYMNVVEEFSKLYYQFVSKEVFAETDTELLKNIIEFLTTSIHHLIAQYQENQTRLELEISQKQTYFDTLLDKYTTVIMALNRSGKRERKRITEEKENFE